jgi:hypothetical protein
MSHNSCAINYSADNIGNAVKPSATMVGAFYGSYFGEIDSFGDPAFRAVGK